MKNPTQYPVLRWQRVLSGLVLLAMLTLPAGALLASGLARVEAAPATPAQAIPPFFPDAPEILPVYHLLPVEVSTETVVDLTQILIGLMPKDVYTDTAFTGTEFYRGINSDTGAEIDQYQGGGFFAYNANLGFDQTPTNPTYDANNICNYLQQNQLLPTDATPETRDCASKELPYTSNNIYMSTLTSTLTTQSTTSPDFTNALTSTQVIGQIWSVPLAINVSENPELPSFVPLGGPGGHLSLLLTGDDSQPSIDSELYGLQGLAMPWRDRPREVIDSYPVVPAPQAYARALRILQPHMPGAILDLGSPQLVYYVDDPAADQQSLMPVWYFPDATGMVDGEVVNLRGFTLPAVDGFLPQVDITSPVEGDVYRPGSSLTVQADLSGGTLPYTYTLLLDDGTPLASGATSDPQLSIDSGVLPAQVRFGSGHVSLVLEVTDANHGSAMDAVSLVTPNQPVYLPALTRDAISLLRGQESVAAASQPAAPTATRRMGVHFIEWYNGTNPDLHGVPPDGNGFYNGLTSLGWQGVYKYPNNAAWEKDWKDCSLGGIDCTYGVDRVDFAYFAGHGSPARMYFGVAHDALNFYAGNARYQNLRYAAFASCQTLRAGPYVGAGNPPLTNWFNAFQGLYMLFGFHTNMADVAFGPRFISNAAPVTFLGITLWQNSLRDAWALTAFQMGAGGAAYLYAVSPTMDPSNNRLPNSAATLPPLTGITGFRWVWWGD
jgi:hypothetical protein